LQLRVEGVEPKLETALVGAPGDAQGLGRVVLTMGDEDARASRLRGLSGEVNLVNGLPPRYRGESD
jgi:hypothetical protein